MMMNLHSAILASDSPMPPLGVFSQGDDRTGDRIALSGRRILLVEDEVFIAFDLRQALEAVGAEVTYARTLSHAMTAAADTVFDAAVLDVTLGPRETCAPVAQLLRDKRTPFVLHSGDLDRQGEVIDLLDAPVVAKPAPPEVVVSRLAKLMARTQSSMN